MQNWAVAPRNALFYLLAHENKSRAAFAKQCKAEDDSEDVRIKSETHVAPAVVMAGWNGVLVQSAEVG